VIHSDDNGTNWSGTLRVNTDSGTNSQFFPKLAVDQTSGKVAVSWYDCRADLTNNRKTQLYAAVSSDGGTTFSANNFQLEAGQSDVSLINDGYGTVNYYDYTGLTYYGGYFYPAWADNSNVTGNNPDGSSNNGMDVYVAKVHF
jgi:hypothetical protein